MSPTVSLDEKGKADTVWSLFACLSAHIRVERCHNKASNPSKAVVKTAATDVLVQPVRGRAGMLAAARRRMAGDQLNRQLPGRCPVACPFGNPSFK